MEKNLNSIEILTNGVAIGLKNAASLLGAIILWVLTCWIPYINIGTTIALSTIPLEMAKGNVFSPLAIFDKKYFAFMGEYFLINGLMVSAVAFGFMFFIIPGIVISIAWSQAVMLMIDKKINPMEALTASNKATTGHKWTIFLAQLALGLVLGILFLIFGKLGTFGVILSIVAAIIIMPISLGMQAHIYKTLCGSKE
ncbi:MAG: hypothetical protein LBU97_03775 [Alistipes sp.]|jgi:uncharacterized membrane protein|nr:hypothetical protein [Alistipes sp.]